MDLSEMNLVWYYIRNISAMRYFLICHKRSERMKLEKRMIETGGKLLKKDFNYKNLIDQLRLSQYETVQHKKKKNVDYSNF